MATVTQRLAFLISANADSAIRAFEKTSGAAAREMAKAEKSLDKVGSSLTKFGAAGLASAGLVGRQLFQAGQAASDLSESINKTRVIFGQGSKEIEEFSKTAANSLGLSKRSALDAASTFAGFGKAAGLSGKELNVFSKDLVTLSADFASFYNTSPEDAIIAIGAALRGEQEPIRRYNVLLNDQVLKQEAATLGIYEGSGALTAQQKVLAAQAAIMKQSADAQGDFGRTSDGLANSQRRLKAAVEDAKAELGAAALPIMQEATNVLLGLAQGFNKANTATGGAISKFVTFGTVGLGVVSTASLLVGQAIKLRDRFGQVDEATGKFNGKLTTLGKTIAIGSAGVSIAALLYADYAATKAEATRVTNDLVGALDAEGDAQKTAIAKLIENNPEIGRSIDLLKSLGMNFVDLAKGTGAAGKQFDALAEAVKGARTDDLNFDLGKLNKTLGLNTDLTYDQAFQLAGAVQAIEMYRSATQKAADAQKIANEIVGDSTEVVDEATNAYNRLAAAFTKNFQYNEMRNRQVDRGAALTEYQQMLEERAAEIAGKNDEKRAKAAQAYADAVDTLASKLQDKLNKALSDAEDNAEKANTAYRNYRDSIAGSVSGVVNLGQAQQIATDNATKLKEANDALFEAQGALNKLGQDPTATAEQTAAAVEKVADAKEALYQAEKLPITFGDVLKGQVAKAGDFKTDLQKVLDLGADKELIDQLTSAGADAGGAIIKGILASADPKGRVEDLDATLASVSTLADTIGTSAADAFFGAGVKLATDLLAGVKDTVDRIDVEKLKTGKNQKRNINRATKRVDQSFATLFGLAGLTVPEMADGGIVKASAGGTLVRLGEGGRDEAVLPLPSTMQQPTIINVTVNAGMGADGTQVGKQIVDELVAYQRRVGALPIKVSG